MLTITQVLTTITRSKQIIEETEHVINESRHIVSNSRELVTKSSSLAARSRPLFHGMIPITEIPVVILVKLNREDTQCLFEHARKHSPAWATLKTSLDDWIMLGDPTSEVVIHSAQEAARDLLDIAEQHCVNAIRQVKLGIADKQH